MRSGWLVPRMVLGGCALLLFQTLFWAPDGRLLPKLALGAFAVFAWLRPRHAMLITAALTPLAGIVSDLIGLGSVRGGEAIVLAFLAAWLLQPRDAGEASLRPAQVTGALFIVTVAASCAVSVCVTRVYWSGPPGFVQGLLFYVGTGYLHQAGSFSVIPLGMLLVEGVGLLAAVPAICGADPRWTRRLLRMTVAGGVGAASTSLLRLGLAFMRSEQPLELLSTLYRGHLRLSVHVGDLNAAGSYFALVGLLALGGAASSRRSVTLWIGCAIAVWAALLLSGSRSAITAGMVGLLAASWLFYSGPRSPRRRRIALIGVAVAVVLTILVTSLFPHVLFGRRARRALEIRTAFVETSLKMLATQPVFGIGIGEYFAHSGAFMPPWLKRIYPRENAHNYFLQIAAELGAVGGVLFLSVIALALREAVRPLFASRGDPQLAGLVAGLTVFLATCLAGHPFLLPPVAFAFWMGLGLALARSRVVMGAAPHQPPDLRPSPAPATTKGRTRLAFAGAAIILLSIPVRARHEIEG